MPGGLFGAQPCALFLLVSLHFAQEQGPPSRGQAPIFRNTSILARHLCSRTPEETWGLLARTTWLTSRCAPQVPGPSRGPAHPAELPVQWDGRWSRGHRGVLVW